MALDVKRIVRRAVAQIVGVAFDCWSYLTEWRAVNRHPPLHAPALIERMRDLAPRRLAVIAAAPGPPLMFSLTNLVNALVNAGYQPIVAVQSEEAAKIIADDLPQVWAVVREPRGRDFGAYKDLFLLLHAAGALTKLEKLILCNDSLYWPSSFDQAIVSLDQKTETWGGVFESYTHNYHLQSFFLVFDSRVFNDPVFIKYWANYRPFSARTHAIQAGELGLSRVLAERFGAPYCELSAWRVISRIRDSVGFCDPGVLRHLMFEKTIAADPIIRQAIRSHAKRGRPALDAGRKSAAPDWMENAILTGVATAAETRNPTHSIGLLANYVFGAPIKRDLAARGTYSFSVVLNLIRHFSPNEIAAIETDLRRKGLPISQRGFRRLLFDAGRI